MARPPHGRRMLGMAAVSVALVVSSAGAAQAGPDSARLEIDGGDGRAVAGRAQERRADRLTDRLGPRRTGGAYIGRDGALVVNVTNAASAQEVRSSGASARRVTYSTRQLARAHAALDRFSRRSGAGSVQGWYVDVRDNTVTVTATAGAEGSRTRAFLRKARSYGGRVEIERTTADAVPAEYLYGGQQVNMSNGGVCSNGFNARTAGGAYILLTAGHCAQGYPAFSRNGVTIGATLDYSFPVDDYASVNINRPAYWNPQPAVDKYDGTARSVIGYSRALVGSPVCKSGRTTGWTCGVIEAYGQTVNYGDGDIVYGLVRHTACVEQGDSGGSNMTRRYAQGVTSGAQLYSSGGRLVCGEEAGQPNVSFYQPVGEALNAYGATLLTIQ
jgi:streptogrisin C